MWKFFQHVIEVDRWGDPVEVVKELSTIKCAAYLEKFAAMTSTT